MLYRIRTFPSCLLVLLFAVSSQVMFAKNKMDGDWEGVVDKYPMVFHVLTGGGTTVDSPKQSIFGMPAFFTLTGKTVRISMLGGAATFEGTVDGPHIVGTFLETGTKYPVTLTKSSKKHDKP
jgi:hypothetical protein